MNPNVHALKEYMIFRLSYVILTLSGCTPQIQSPTGLHANSTLEKR